jgi:hypothetical protein
MKQLAFGSLTVLSIAILVLAMSPAPAMADNIPYGTGGSGPVGTIAPTAVFTATASGTVGYFYGFSAADTDKIAACDVTTDPTCTGLVYKFVNQTSTIGTSATLLSGVTAGNTIAFFIDNTTTGSIFSSDPALSSDRTNHVYATPYSDTGSETALGIPAGLFLGFEDLDRAQSSDWDYNDDEIVVTGVSIATPEPGSLVMLGSGLIGLVGLRRRKLAD